MSANEEFFRSRKSAAVLKHGILKRYPVVFASMTGQSNPVVFLDGYAVEANTRTVSPAPRCCCPAAPISSRTSAMSAASSSSRTPTTSPT